jgi:hypothetical protein
MSKKPGKYAAFKSLYPKVPFEATVFEKMREVLDAPASPDMDALRVRDLPNTELKDIYVKARRAKDALDLQVSLLETQIAAYTYLFVQRMEEDDVTALPFTDGVQLGSSVEPYPNVKDRGALYKWVKDTEQTELLTLNYQTLASIVKQRLLEGETLPPGVEVFMKDKLTARGLNTNKGATSHDEGN